ncbi:MAG: hypothetical protein L0Z70_09995 [Chloroflexi bacterium]|nr:hypothetical protein [Chloroflexota bacterium]
MEYQDEILAAAEAPQDLENLYQAARWGGEFAQFKQALEVCYQHAPDNLLYAAWHFRLGRGEAPARAAGGPNWKLALLLGVATGLIFWLLFQEKLVFSNDLPYLFVFWSPIAALFALVYLTAQSGRGYLRSLITGAVLIAAIIYVYVSAKIQFPPLAEHYINLMMIHMPVLSWIALGFNALDQAPGVQNRFAFLMKSVETAVTAGLYLMAGMAFFGITMGMLDALGVEVPEIILRGMAAGGFGLLPVLALATQYNPKLRPEEQDFSQGLSKFIATLMRLLLPLTFLVLVIYIFIIPFFFNEPFENRDVLIVYNVMLFAVVGLLLGVTPVHLEEVSANLQTWLRRGILAASALAALVSLYALSATVYRTVLNGVTMNRMTIIGWNTINIALLALVVVGLVRRSEQPWADRIKSVFSLGMIAYLAWDIFIIVAVPIFYH